jgi:6-phosphogluconolactonase
MGRFFMDFIYLAHINQYVSSTMKKLLLIIALVSPVLCIAQKKGKAPKVFDLVIGAFTGDAPTASKGIYVYRFYEETGKVAYLSEVDTQNPSFLTVSADQQFIYAVNENNGTTPSSVSAFKFTKSTGKLELLNSQPSIGSPAYVSVDKAQKNVFIANYGGGSLQVYPVNKDGSLGASSQTVQDVGEGPNTARQLQPHVHSAVLSPDDKYLIFSDLGTDKINIFRYKASKMPPLTPAEVPFFKAAAGSGPRHSDFAPNGKFMYNIQELTATISVFGYNGGELKELQNIKMMPDDFKGLNGAADIHVSPDGLFLYATNRGSVNEIFVYAIDQVTGKLTPVDHYPTGNTPRNFVIDPTGKYIMVGSSNRIVQFKVDKATGKLTLTNTVINMDSAVCLKMIPIE